MDAPVIGADGPASCGAGEWQVSTSWRYQKSDRHFRGDEEQTERTEEGSEVINDIHLADLSIRYNFSHRTSVALGIPYLMAQRSSPIRNDEREVVGRSISHATGLGDITLTGRRWMIDPMNAPNGNVALGLGFKLPTGESSTLDTRERLVDGEIERSLRTNDQSIQPGDGGFGLLFDLLSYYRLAGGKLAVYASGMYLSNPEESNGVLTYRSRDSEAVMSIADQYVARVGANALVPGTSDRLSFSLGGRIEGVPAEDILGGSEDFRRPGYAVSVEPALSFRTSLADFDVAVPVAVYRNRVRSVPDKMEEGRHGDAAFADWVLLAGIRRTL
jgi:hypothetical protein